MREAAECGAVHPSCAEVTGGGSAGTLAAALIRWVSFRLFMLASKSNNYLLITLELNLPS